MSNHTSITDVTMALEEIQEILSIIPTDRDNAAFLELSKVSAAAIKRRIRKIENFINNNRTLIMAYSLTSSQIEKGFSSLPRLH